MQNDNWKNKLYFGDNLDILRDKIKDDFVDLIYLDPPFQSGRNYNQIFQAKQGEAKGATAQITAFEDTWQWGAEAENNYEGLLTGEINKAKAGQKLVDLMKALRGYLGEVPMMAYLSMMATRLLEMRRVLKDTGSIFLHCDPTASHYLKLLMDAIFGVDNFRNEIIWHYKTGGISKKWFGRKHDNIYFYSKSNKYIFNPIEIKEYYNFKPAWQDRRGGKDEKGYYHFVYSGDVWDIPAVFNMSKERVGYPTQKPEKLLERIIKATTNKEDIVMDSFCGCGTTVAVAQRLQRRWIGIDITYLAIDVIAKRLEKSGYKKDINFVIEGEPKDIYSAEKLAKYRPFQFELWCVAKLNATPSPRQTGDKGVDGTLNFVDLTKEGKAGKGIIQVKGTQMVNPAMVRDLKGTIKSQDADFGILITLKKATRGMISEANKSGYFNFQYTPEIAQQKIPIVQLLTTQDLFKKPLPVILPPIMSIMATHKNPLINETKEQDTLL